MTRTRIATLSGACLFALALAFPYPALAQTQEAQESESRGQGSYSMSGVIREVDDDDIEIDREGLPKAELDIERRTQITVDGQQARADDLRRGMQVSVQFEVVDDDVVATEIAATGSGAR